jgi:hypothetical protein
MRACVQAGSGCQMFTGMLSTGRLEARAGMGRVLAFRGDTWEGDFRDEDDEEEEEAEEESRLPAFFASRVWMSRSCWWTFPRSGRLRGSPCQQLLISSQHSLVKLGSCSGRTPAHKENTKK